MSGTEDDSRCQKAVRIITELCRKKSLPALHLNTCREFLLPSDQSLSISEPAVLGSLEEQGPFFSPGRLAERGGLQ